MMYSIARAVRPIAALRLVSGKCLNELMITLYVASRVLNFVLNPIMVGTCPAAMLIADPVMKAEMAARVMNSVSQPSLANPRKQMIPPQTMARADATTWAGTLGSFLWTSVMTFPVMVDMTATGPIVMSFDVAKNQ